VISPRTLVRVRQSPRDLPGGIPALDGIRGLAVLQVLTSHLHVITGATPFTVTPWRWFNKTLEPGFLGVDIFFVLSGFLITSILLRDSERGSKGLFRNFYARRALRLLPAMYVLLLASFVVALWEGFPMDIQWRTTWHALLYLNNWNVQWNFLGTQDDLGHLWSLAIEEQFYLVWPAVIWLLFKLRFGRWVMMALTVITIIVVAWHRREMWNDGVSWLFLYLRTDTRVDSLLMGALFAVVYRHVAIDPKTLNWLAMVGLVGILYIKYNPGDSFIFVGGFTLIAFLAGLVILSSADGSWWGNRLVSLAPFRLLGKVSYGLYLWHAFLFRVMARHVTSGPQSVRVLVALLLAAAFTALSWFLVERPFLGLKERRYGHAPAR